MNQKKFTTLTFNFGSETSPATATVSTGVGITIPITPGRTTVTVISIAPTGLVTGRSSVLSTRTADVVVAGVLVPSWTGSSPGVTTGLAPTGRTGRSGGVSSRSSRGGGTVAVAYTPGGIGTASEPLLVPGRGIVVPSGSETLLTGVGTVYEGGGQGLRRIRH